MLEHYARAALGLAQSLLYDIARRGRAGAKDVKQDLDPGKLEYQYALNDRGRALGLTQAQIANVIRNG